MINPKCKICGKTLDRKTAYCIKKNDKNQYYCSEEEYNIWINEKEKKEEIRNCISSISCCVMSKVCWIDIENCISFLNKFYSLDQILDYIKYDAERILDILSDKDFQSNVAKVRYVIAVIQNNINDYIQSVEQAHPQELTEIDFYIAPFKYKPTNMRRAMIEIEEAEDGDLDDDGE